jgi:heme exporter protein B
MIATLFQLLRRDLAHLLLGGRSRQSGGGTMLPLLFFLAVAMLFPFAVGPDPKLLARTGGGVIWVAALLAAILPLDRLVEPDIELGMIDQWSLRGIAEEWIVAVRILAHWLSFGPPLMLAALAGLLVIPLAVPLLVFGAGSLSSGETSGIALTAAVSLMLLAMAPFAAGAAIRAARG